MRIEIDDMYQNVPVKATLESGVTLIDGESAVGKSFFFEALEFLAPLHDCSCCHIQAIDSVVARYIAETDIKKREKYYDNIVSKMLLMDIVAISNADIFVTKEMLLTVLSQNPEVILLLETKITPNYYYLRSVPIRFKQIFSSQASLVLSRGTPV